MEKEVKNNVIREIVNKLEKCGDNCEFVFESLLLEMEDGSRCQCKKARAVNGNLFVRIALPVGVATDLSGEQLLLVKYPNAIFNAIEVPDQKKEYIDEIISKLSFQPVMPYVFSDTFYIELEDGNKFYPLHVSINEVHNLEITLCADYCDEFVIDDHFVTLDGLKAISDEIMPPKEIVVTVHDGENEPVLIHRLNVMWNFTEEQLSEYLKAKFPAFDWIADDVFQMVYYPDKKNKNSYILANCWDA